MKLNLPIQDHRFSQPSVFFRAHCPSALMLLFIGLFLPACRQGTTVVSTNPEPAGTYALVSINGNKLPYTPPHEGGAPEVQSSAMTLKADGTFTSTVTYGMPGGKSSSHDFSGTFTCEDTRLTLRWNGAGLTILKLEGNSFTMDNEGILFTYRK
jgi:hypothetical protein